MHGEGKNQAGSKHEHLELLRRHCDQCLNNIKVAHSVMKTLLRKLSLHWLSTSLIHVYTCLFLCAYSVYEHKGRGKGGKEGENFHTYLRVVFTHSASSLARSAHREGFCSCLRKCFLLIHISFSSFTVTGFLLILLRENPCASSSEVSLPKLLSSYSLWPLCSWERYSVTASFKNPFSYTHIRISF